MARRRSTKADANRAAGVSTQGRRVSKRKNKNAMENDDLRGKGKAGAKKGGFSSQYGTRRQQYSDIRAAFGLSTG